MAKKSKKSKKVSGKKKGSGRTTGGTKWKPKYDGQMTVSATSWGMARETFKRTKRDKVFVNAKASTKGHYVIYYRNRSKATAKPKGAASSAVSKYFGSSKPKTKKVKKTKKKGGKKKKTTKKKKGRK